MAPAPGVHIPLRYLRALVKKGASILRNRISAEKASNNRLFLSEGQIQWEPAYARAAQRNNVHPIHQRTRVARRWYTTHFAGYLNSAAHGSGSAAGRAGSETVSRYQSSKIGSAVSRLTTTSPFAHTLRPKLTGGALPRMASGYSLGNGGLNGARYFSHSNPTATAQVIAQVSAGVRAFLLQGKDEMESIMKQRNQGISGGIFAHIKTTKKQKETTAPPKGAFVDFNIAPTLTCLSPLGNNCASTVSLETSGFMEDLSNDFTHMMKNLTVILADIQKMKSEIGDLPISLVADPKSTKISLRVFFPDREPSYVEGLCEDVGIRRGVVGSVEDEQDPVRTRDKAWGEAFKLIMPTLVLPNGCATPAIPKPWDGPTTVYNSGEIRWNDMLSYPASEDGELSEYSDGFSDDWYEDGDAEGGIFEGGSVDVAHEAWSSGSESAVENHEYPRDHDELHGLQRFLEECEEYRTSRNPWRG